jgi:hypothetical protein
VTLCSQTLSICFSTNAFHPLTHRLVMTIATAATATPLAMRVINRMFLYLEHVFLSMTLTTLFDLHSTLPLFL